MRSHEDLAEVRHPLAENSVAALQLLNALPSSLALSVDDIVEAPPAGGDSVLALPLHTAPSFAKELPIELRDEMPLVRALGLKQRVLARPLALHVAGSRWAIRAAARQGASSSAHAAGFSRSHACTHRKAAEEVILSSCGGLNKHYRESERARARDLFFFRFRQSTPSSGSAAAAVSERAPEAGAPRGRGRRARSLAERKRPASAAAPGCASVPAAASCERRGRRPCR